MSRTSVTVLSLNPLYLSFIPPVNLQYLWGYQWIVFPDVNPRAVLIVALHDSCDDLNPQSTPPRQSLLPITPCAVSLNACILSSSTICDHKSLIYSVVECVAPLCMWFSDNKEIQGNSLHSFTACVPDLRCEGSAEVCVITDQLASVCLYIVIYVKHMGPYCCCVPSPVGL